MVTHAEIERRHALIELMTLPDEASLRRGHRLVFEGRPDRYRLCPMLAAAYAQATLLRMRERRQETEMTLEMEILSGTVHPGRVQ